MNRPRRKVYALIVFWMLVAVVYTWTGWQQSRRLNLSATAGGQMPYLVYAQGVAKDGLLSHFGDRNRMPLIPSLLSFLHDDDWDVFVSRAGTFSIISSMVILAGIGVMAYRRLPSWPATVLVLTAAVCIFPYKASFVQAELAYYGLLFATWLCMCQLLRRSSWTVAVVCGVLLGLTFLAKASAVGALVAFLFAAICRAVLPYARQARSTAELESRKRSASTGMRDAVIVIFVFFSVALPYLGANKSRFGRYFYNVNSTFFMWCDSWSQAKAFGDAYDVASRYPDAPPNQIPGPANYWRSHSLSQIGRRLSYGFTTLADLALRGSYAKFIAAALGVCVVLAMRQRSQWNRIMRERTFVLLFCGLFGLGYLLSYAWYVQVAFGDRFVLSLVLPLMCGLLWLATRLGREMQPVVLLGRRMPFADVLSLILVILLLVDGGKAAVGGAYEPTREFVQFYYNETRELQLAGNLAEADKGFRGVITLDPQFAPAYHDLGMTALVSGRTDAAVESLSTAVALSPDKADVRNSYGSALLQAGRSEEALAAFREAVRLEPTLAAAWYNLGGTCHMIGKKEEALEVLARLKLLDKRKADQLASIIGR